MSESRPVWRSRVLYVVLAVGMLAPLDVPLLGPALPEIAAAFEMSDARAGLVVTAFAAPGVFAAPVLGWLADRWGRRAVLLPCLVVYGVAGVLVAAVDSFPLVLGLRAVQGLMGGSILSSLALTLAGDLFSGARRNAAMGATSAAVTVSAAVAPAAGGALAGVSWNAPFLLYGLSLLVAVVVFLVLPEPTTAAGGDGANADVTADVNYLRAAREALPIRATLGVYAAAFVSYTLFFGAVLTAVPFLLSDAYGLGSGRIGLLVTGASLVGAVVALLNGRLAAYASSTRLVAVGLCGYGLGLGGVFLAGSPLGVGLGLAVFGAGHGLTQPSIAAALSALSPTRFRGGVMSLRTSVVLASQAVGPLLFTVPVASVGYDSLLGVAGGVTLGVGAAALALTR